MKGFETYSKHNFKYTDKKKFLTVLVDHVVECTKDCQEDFLKLFENFKEAGLFEGEERQRLSKHIRDYIANLMKHDSI